VATESPRDGGDPAGRRPEGALECGRGETGRLEQRFHAAMMEVYLEAASLGYRPAHSLEMVRECGGLAIAAEILAADRVHEGLAELFHLGRLDLAVEYLVLLPEYEALFSDDERRTAQRRIGLARRTEPRP
jgi:hypothetical protein